MEFVTLFLTFLMQHMDLVIALKDALEGGQTEAQLMASIKAGMVAGSDAAVEAELGPRPK